MRFQSPLVYFAIQNDKLRHAAYKMCLDARNPDFVAREQQKHRQSYAFAQLDQRLCYFPSKNDS